MGVGGASMGVGGASMGMGGASMGMGGASIRHPHSYVAERTVSPTPVTTTVRLSKAPVAMAATHGSQMKTAGDVAKNRMLNDLGNQNQHQQRLAAGLQQPGMKPRMQVDMQMSSDHGVPRPSSMGSDSMIRLPDVGPSNLPRKLSPVGRGMPPPIPPNKPQLLVMPTPVSNLRPSKPSS